MTGVPSARAAPGTPAGAGPRVVVAILTYLRPDDLRAALESVVAQLDDLPTPATVLVVDNDPDASAIAALAGEHPAAQVRFVHEPTPGIAAARNRALDEAGPADALVFIDDDERPEPGWLAALVATWQASGAAAVVGPVTSVYPADPEPWIEAGRFFARRRLATGTLVSVFATNNVLLDLAEVRRRGVRFDLRFGETGGSDSLFSRQLDRDGARMVWCAEAVVVDVVPPERLTRRWVLRRALRSGNTFSRTIIAVEPRRARRAARRLTVTAQGLARIAGGGARLVAGVVVRSTVHEANGARTLARGLGMTGGAWGYTRWEYKRRPPRQ